MNYPTLGIDDRNERWHRVREMMRGEDIECLVVAGLYGRERYDGYLTNQAENGVVIFPAEGEPVSLMWTSHRIVRRLAPDAPEFWVEDVRSGRYSDRVVEVLRQRGLSRSRIGVVGIETRGPMEMDGLIPYRMWSQILEALPEIDPVDVSLKFGAVMLQKSPSEQELLRHAAAIGEAACARLLDEARQGANEYDLFAGVMHEIHRQGGVSVPPHLILWTGPEIVGWGPPYWAYSGGPPRVIQDGDMIETEIFACYGGFETQQQMAIALEPVAPVHHELADVAKAAHRQGVEALRPGVTFGNVAEAMAEPIKEAGCWHLSPLIHSLGPLSWIGASPVGIDQLPGGERYDLQERPIQGADLEIKAGMSFAFEANACRGTARVNVGGTVLVTDEGCEELNSAPLSLNIK